LGFIFELLCSPHLNKRKDLFVVNRWLGLPIQKDMGILGTSKGLIELRESLQQGFDSIKSIDPISTKKIRHRNKKYPTYIPSGQSKSQNRKPFLVADTETISLDKEKGARVHSTLRIL